MHDDPLCARPQPVRKSKSHKNFFINPFQSFQFSLIFLDFLCCCSCCLTHLFLFFCSEVGKSLVEGVKAVLLCGRRVHRSRGSDAAALSALDAALQCVLLTVRQYMRCRAELQSSGGAPNSVSNGDSVGSITSANANVTSTQIDSNANSAVRFYAPDELRHTLAHFDSAQTTTGAQNIATASKQTLIALLSRVDDDATGIARKPFRVQTRNWPKTLCAKEFVVWAVRNAFAPNAVSAAALFTALCRDG